MALHVCIGLFVFSLTLKAISFYLKCVLDAFEKIFSAKLILNRLKFWRKYLYNSPAFKAYQMVVVPVTEDVFIMGMLVIFFYLFYQAAFKKEGQCPVDGCPGNPDVSASHAYKQFFRIKMSMKGKDLVKDPLPFLCELKALLIKKSLENLFFHEDILNEIETKFQFPLDRKVDIEYL